jgi:Cof subfamily protein (haloacid dehalogenase superfamily)
MSDKERLKNIKIVVSDLDGTLLKNDGSVGLETKKLIRELHNYDVLFSFATGRLHSAVTDIAKDLEIKNPIISLDGSVIKNFPTGETIFESFLKKKHVEKAVKYADDYLLNVALCHSDAIYYTEFNTVIPKLLNKFGAKYKEVSSYENLLDKTLEIVFAGDNKESIEFVKDKFTFPYAFGCNASYYRSQSKKGLFYLDIRRAGSSKGKGLKRLLKYLHIKTRQAVVMGDWYNDISMFESDAIKVAVANSIPELIKNADHVTERSNNNEGPAEFLEMILRAKIN